MPRCPTRCGPEFPGNNRGSRAHHGEASVGSAKKPGVGRRRVLSRIVAPRRAGAPKGGGRRVETPKGPAPKGGPKAAGGFHTTAREPNRAHVEVPAFKTPTKIPQEDLQEREGRINMWRERKKERHFGRSGGGGVRKRPVRGSVVWGREVRGRGGRGSEETKENKRKNKEKRDAAGFPVTSKDKTSILFGDRLYKSIQVLRLVGFFVVLPVVKDESVYFLLKSLSHVHHAVFLILVLLQRNQDVDSVVLEHLLHSRRVPIFSRFEFFPLLFQCKFVTLNNLLLSPP